MKYKGFHRMICILLSAALVFTSLAGCEKKGTSESPSGAGGDDSGGRAMGRYMEEELSLPAEFSSIYDMKKLEDGSIRIAGCSEDRESVWETKDLGISWEKV